MKAASSLRKSWESRLLARFRSRSPEIPRQPSPHPATVIIILNQNQSCEHEDSVLVLIMFQETCCKQQNSQCIKRSLRVRLFKNLKQSIKSLAIDLFRFLTPSCLRGIHCTWQKLLTVNLNVWGNGETNV